MLTCARCKKTDETVEEITIEGRCCTTHRKVTMKHVMHPECWEQALDALMEDD